MPGIKERTRHIHLWVAIFGTRPRASIKAWEIQAVAEGWRQHGPKVVWRRWAADGDDRPGGRYVEIPAPLSASQVNNRLRALENLWTVLDGRHAPNPVREVSEYDEPESEARGLPYDVVEAILAAMPEDRYRRALSPEAVAAIRSQPGVHASELARAYRVSETAIRKARVRRRPPVTGTALARLRLRVIAYVGLSHGELMGVSAGDLHLDDTPPWLWVSGRKKGKGTGGTPQPLTPEGAAAVRALAAAGGLGPFSHSSLWKSFQRACQKLGLVGVRPYDLRHSFASEIFEATGDLSVTQLLMRQRSPKTTLRYGQRAISPVLAAAIQRVRDGRAFTVREERPE